MLLQKQSNINTPLIFLSPAKLKALLVFLKLTTLFCFLLQQKFSMLFTIKRRNRSCYLLIIIKAKVYLVQRTHIIHVISDDEIPGQILLQVGSVGECRCMRSADIPPPPSQRKQKKSTWFLYLIQQ